MGVYYGKADFVNYGKPSLFLDFANKKSLVDRMSGNNLITFGRNSTGTYVGADGLIKTASANEARFDHDPLTGESLGLLVEESRSNLATYSEQLNLWTNNGNAITISSNAETAPDGTLTADRISQSSATNANRVLSNVGITYSSQTITMSVWARKVSGTDSGGRIGFGYFGDGGIRQYIDPTSTWQRYTYTRTLGASGSAAAAIMSEWDINGAANNNVYALWGFQVEVGAFPTSYIPTTSVAVTRSVDEASITGSNFSSWFNRNEGTMVIYAKNTKDPNPPLIFTTSSYYQGAGGYKLGLSGFWSNATQLSTDAWENGVSLGGSNIIYYQPESESYLIRHAFSYSSTSCSSAMQGFLGTTGGNECYRAAQGLDRLLLQQYFIIVTSTISRVTFYPTRLTDAQLQSITR
jgi:hypothetical protein